MDFSNDTTIKPVRKILIAATGSVATIKLPELIAELNNECHPFKFEVKIMITEHTKHFFELELIPENVPVLHNRDEWISWNKRGDPVLHIELAKWADLLVIAPLSANSLAKIATGHCDNLVTCVVRAWNLRKPLLFAPAMNTRMYDHPITREHIDTLVSWGYKEIPVICKTLMCGDTGNGAMAQVSTIVSAVVASCGTTDVIPDIN
ncbi:phosphopantothenoylcysteine decarboxylase [Scaptodrosophila lebanonensis]|uniref:Phosphopantothenoylcysteine decarboxylase n=1 Tax=Drosophila lebanonensis TaxID=7225 RepID=A0A6J2TUC7_DROLE|nr:phosphopantothenoylcysteine decarboxylase [Scaptodrosophila lebanonensis]